LVQKVYGEDPVEMAESLQNLYEEMRREHENRIASKNTRAKHIVLLHRFCREVLKIVVL